MVAKRALDIGLGAVLAVLSLPMIVVLAVGSAISFRAWPFFLHYRVGRGGRLFRCPKLRSLPVETPAYATKYELGSAPTSPFGQWMRRHHLDELPQLLLVLVGRMSLVGPRPEMPSMHQQFSVELIQARFSVRPGCTGLWQIGADSHRLIAECPEYDLTYVRHAGIRLDLWILWRSLRVILSGGPNMRLEEIPRYAVPAARPARGGALQRRPAFRPAAAPGGAAQCFESHRRRVVPGEVGHPAPAAGPEPLPQL